MTNQFPVAPAIWGYAFSALVFAVFLARLLLGWQSHVRSWVLALAMLSSLIWSATMAFSLFASSPAVWFLACSVDAVRLATWMIFLSVLSHGWQRPGNAMMNASGFVIGPAILIAGGILVPQIPPWLATGNASENPIGAYYFFLGGAVFGLVQVEQLYRQTSHNRRWAIKPLAIGLGGMFALDLVIFSSAVLFHQIEPTMWAARGIAAAIVTFFVAIATARNLDWTIDVYVSRAAVFQSTTLLIAGLYLLLVAFGAYWVHVFGGDWGGTLRVTFLFAAVLLLAAILMSGTFRAKLKAYISKNLFSYRYDYRAEWLGFTNALRTEEKDESLYHQVIRALANLLESGGGILCLEKGGYLTEVARLNATGESQAEPLSAPFAEFLADREWVLQLDEYRRTPTRYAGPAFPVWILSIEDAWLVVPLLDGKSLIGIVVLLRPLAPIDVNWEVRDLLKTASRQAAIFLAQVRAKEMLVETEKFGAFNRMSAFVVHDLKNLVAQMALMLKNAERHRENPEFQRDMLETIEHVVDRMNKLMLQLRIGTSAVEKPRSVDIVGIIESVRIGKEVLGTALSCNLPAHLRAMGHEDRLERVIGHIIQNAIDATRQNSGTVSVRAYSSGEKACVEVSDTGIGMSDDFVRNRLFHPFQTTKANGMGIGMYESQQYIRGLGGKIEVESSPGKTVVCMYLPGASNSNAETRFS